MGPRLRSAISILKESAAEFSKDRVPQLSAAVAYYTIFSLAPILVISISVAGLFFGEKAARGEIVGTIDDLVGPVAAEQIETMIDEAARAKGGVLATILGVAAILFGASGVFYQLSLAMDQIWDVDDRADRGISGIVKDRFAAFAVVLSVGFLLLSSLVVSASLAAFGRFIENRMDGFTPLWQTIDVAVSFAVITVLFAILFRYLPDRRVEWRWVWSGAALTSLLFAVGKYALGLYLGRSTVGSTFGAAGSLAVVLIWIYFSAIIFFFGAEITEVISRRERGKPSTASSSSTSDETEIPQVGGQTTALPQRPGQARFAVGAASGASLGCFGGLILGFTGAVVALVRSVLRLLRR